MLWILGLVGLAAVGSVGFMDFGLEDEEAEGAVEDQDTEVENEATRLETRGASEFGQFADGDPEVEDDFSDEERELFGYVNWVENGGDPSEDPDDNDIGDTVDLADDGVPTLIDDFEPGDDNVFLILDDTVGEPQLALRDATDEPGAKDILADGNVVARVLNADEFTINDITLLTRAEAEKWDLL